MGRSAAVGLVAILVGVLLGFGARPAGPIGVQVDLFLPQGTLAAVGDAALDISGGHDPGSNTSGFRLRPTVSEVGADRIRVFVGTGNLEAGEEAARWVVDRLAAVGIVPRLELHSLPAGSFASLAETLISALTLLGAMAWAIAGAVRATLSRQRFGVPVAPSSLGEASA